MPADSASTLATAVFDAPAQVERAFDVATALGYPTGDVNVVMSDETRRLHYAHTGVDEAVTDKSAEGGELGGPKGGRVGLAIPIVAAIAAAVAIPGLGLVMSGPLAAALAGAGAAAAAAGLIGAMADWGLPEDRLRQYESEIARGGILLGIKARSADDARRIAEAWTAIGGRHVHA